MSGESSPEIGVLDLDPIVLVPETVAVSQPEVWSWFFSSPLSLPETPEHTTEPETPDHTTEPEAPDHTTEPETPLTPEPDRFQVTVAIPYDDFSQQAQRQDPRTRSVVFSAERTRRSGLWFFERDGSAESDKESDDQDTSPSILRKRALDDSPTPTRPPAKKHVRFLEL